jgi:hypothetical protein
VAVAVPAEPPLPTVFKQLLSLRNA